MKKTVKYETPQIEIMYFEIDKRLMNDVDFETNNGQTVPWEGTSKEDVTVDDLGLVF